MASSERQPVEVVALSNDMGLGEGESERRELRDLVRSFLRRHCPEAVVRAVMESDDGYDPALWRRCVQQLELTSLIVPTRYGGMGCGWRELGVVMQEMGASLYPGPFLSQVFATTAMLHLAAASACADLLPGICTGSTLVAFSAAGVDRPGAAREPLRCKADFGGNGTTTFTGTLDVVLDAHLADRLVVLTRARDGEGLLVVFDPSASGVRVTPLLGMDLTRRLSRVELTDAAGVDVTSPDLSPASVDRCYALMIAALAAEQLGGAEQAFQLTLDYLRTRVQFGRVIGSFQAIKHRCADLALALEAARATCMAVLESADGGSQELVLESHLAAAMCSDAYLAVARAMIQLHGGIGFTWEHSAHLHLKRAKTSQMLLGLPALHRRMVGQQLGVGGADARY